MTTVHDYNLYNNKTKCATWACLRCTLIILMSGPLFIFYVHVNTQTSTNHNWIKKKWRFIKSAAIHKKLEDDKKSTYQMWPEFQTGRKNLKGTT